MQNRLRLPGQTVKYLVKNSSVTLVAYFHVGNTNSSSSSTFYLTGLVHALHPYIACRGYDGTRVINRVVDSYLNRVLSGLNIQIQTSTKIELVYKYLLTKVFSIIFVLLY